MSSTCEMPALQEEALSKLKYDSALSVSKPKWATIVDLVVQVVGAWANRYNSIRNFENDRKFDLSNEERVSHLKILDQMISVGCETLLLIHNVEDYSKPPADLTELEKNITQALRALKISRSAFSQSIEQIEEAVFRD